MLTLKLLWGGAPGLTRVPGEADHRSARNGAGILEVQQRIDLVPIGVKSERQSDLETLSLAAQHQLARLVRQDELLLVDGHRDHFGGAIRVRRDLQPAWPEVSGHCPPVVGPDPELEPPKPPPPAGPHGAIER